MAIFILAAIVILVCALGWVFLAQGWLWAGVALLGASVLFVIWFFLGAEE
jgi:hypothetical protein